MYFVSKIIFIGDIFDQRYFRWRFFDQTTGDIISEIFWPTTCPDAAISEATMYTAKSSTVSAAKSSTVATTVATVTDSVGGVSVAEKRAGEKWLQRRYDKYQERVQKKRQERQNGNQCRRFQAQTQAETKKEKNKKNLRVSK